MFSVSKHSLIRTQKFTLIFVTLTEVLSKVILYDKMQKNTRKLSVTLTVLN